MYKWLERQLADRSVAEMSIMHTLVSVCSFLVILIYFGVTGFAKPIIFLTTMGFWFIGLFWLWIGLVKAAWKSPSERLGLWVFRLLHIGIFVMLLVTVVLSCRSFEELKILLLLILAFDVAIAWLIVNFVFLAWFARCKIPLYVYCEIGSMIGMVVLQVWLANK